jgi:lysozyme
MAATGIDVSHWQGNINWEKVKASGIKFAIIKAGGSDDGFYTDSKWEANYKGAKAHGIAVGAYYFAGPKCVTADAGKADAKRFIKLLKSKKLEYPVYFDCEVQPASKRSGTTKAAIAFCKELEKAGYYAGIYASTYSGFQDRLDDSKLTSFAHWVAQYASKCSYKGDYGIWQYSSSGKVPGISGNVDMDLSNVDYPAVIKKRGLNGYSRSDTKTADPEAKAGKKTADALISVMEGWLGYSEKNGKYKKIIDIYNSHQPLARGYKMKYSDAWCDATVSAAAIQSEMTDLIGTEISCPRHIEIFKKKGIWKEDGTITPKRGDIILYNWHDSTQPNNGSPTHIGVVTSVKNGKITAIEGNHKDAVGYRTIPVGWGYIRGYARPKYDGTNSTTSSKKTTEEIAREVIAGKWGNGTIRKQKLKKAGYDYDAVQRKVNQLVK